MKKFAKLFFGFSITAIGVLWILNVTGVIGFDVFFRGWWTLLIILPCTAHMIARPNWGSFSGMAIGAILLLQAQGFIDWSIFWKLCLAIIFIASGLALIFSKSHDPRHCCHHFSKRECIAIDRDGENILKITSAFGEMSHRVEAEVFNGADIEAAFGSVCLDLRDAIFTENEDVRIHVKASFAGVEIRVPDDVSVEVRSNSVFGGVNNKTADSSDRRSASHTILLVAECSFAGVEIM